MEVKNCKGCGKLYNSLGAATPMCPACMKALDEKYEAVKQYVYDNPRISINQLSEDMEVPIPQIQRWIREERLTFSEDSEIGIECEGCGAMIKTGRFCATCKQRMKQEMGNAIARPRQEIKKPEKDSPRMRFLDN